MKMLDTIILQIPLNKCSIADSDYRKFGATKDQIFNTFLGFKKWENNPTAQDKKDGIYKPRLTLIKRGGAFVIKIEFSAPKMIFNNNLDELEETDFDSVVKTLRERIRSMGVLVWSKDIEEAKVLSFHPSKNITLSGGYTANFAIRELKKIDFSKRFDLDEKKFRNGEVLQLYTKSHSFVLYDKINDLKKPKSRAIDKNRTPQQMDLFEYIQKENKRLEVLRLETRLSSKRKMNEQLEKLGYAPNPPFKEIFKQELCKKIINQYWNDFFSDNQFIFNINSNPQDILQLILRRYPKIKIIKAINIVGLYSLCRDEEGMRGFRKTIDSHKPKSNWDTVKKYIKMLDDEIFANPTWGFIPEIKQQLGSFESFKVDKIAKKSFDM